MTSSRKQQIAAVQSPKRKELSLLTVAVAILITGSLSAWLQREPGCEEAGQVSRLPSNPEKVSQTSTIIYRQPIFHNENRVNLLLEQARAINQMGMSDECEDMLMALVNQTHAEDIRNVLEALRDRDDVTDALRLRLIHRWLETDAQAAARWAQQLPTSPERDSALSDVAVQWANICLTNAATWATTLPDVHERDSLLATIANEEVRSDPLAALQIVVRLPTSRERNELISHSAMEWAAQDGKSAADWALQFEPGPLRDQVLASVALAWCDKDPESAVNLVSHDIPAGRAQANAVIGIVQRLAQQQPAQAVAWVEQFPVGELKQTALDNLVAHGVVTR